METAASYVARAQEAAELAARELNPEVAAALLRIAETWTALAEAQLRTVEASFKEGDAKR